MIIIFFELQIVLFFHEFVVTIGNKQVKFCKIELFTLRSGKRRGQ